MDCNQKLFIEACTRTSKDTCNFVSAGKVPVLKAVPGYDSSGIAPRAAGPSPEIRKARPGLPRRFQKYRVVCISFTLLSLGATRHALALNLGAQPYSEGPSHLERHRRWKR